ncbi:glycoside hydrolase family 19 protein [Yanghanlia caeni]|uniref:Glycoside hydrolase family 19 protein n=1 Tax=Yanghanlia caeni TaxID=3064283 RepID=A0ABU1D9B9_9BURK|nr:glycoside hydrolase family 19 protein [Alcaligenaceae bacterium LG-2]
MTQLTAQQVAEATGATLVRSALWLPHLTAAMRKYNITEPLHVAAFLAQIGVESGALSRLTENLNYSAPRLRQVWPSRFKSDAVAQRYANNPRDLANYVYGSRMGNQPGSDDGWNYRGRGLKQLTGRDNYTEYQRASGVPVLANPDYLVRYDYAADSAAWFWHSRGCGGFVDRGDWQGLTKRINGGLNGHSERMARTQLAIDAIC